MRQEETTGLWKPVDDSLFCCFFCSFVIVHFPATTHPFLHAYPVLISPRSNHHSQNGSVAGAQLADPGTTALGLNAALPLSSCVPSAGVASWSLCSFFCKMEFIVATLKPWRENGDFVGKPLTRGSTVSVNSRVLSWYIITRIQGSWCPKGCFSHLWRELLKQYHALLSFWSEFIGRDRSQSTLGTCILGRALVDQGTFLREMSQVDWKRRSPGRRGEG